MVDEIFMVSVLKESLCLAATEYWGASKRVVLSGAGISVDCGIPDFRSQDGLWSRYSPDIYATLGTFRRDPELAWAFYRALGKMLHGRFPGQAHKALACLESAGLLDGVITQNIDGLHQESGSCRVVEVHGNANWLHCIECGASEKGAEMHLEGALPCCQKCGYPLKPRVVLFGEPIRAVDEMERLIEGCDLLLLIGTSATVDPVAQIPFQVRSAGGCLIEFNITATQVSDYCSYRFGGRADETVPRFVDSVLHEGSMPVTE